MDKLQPLSDLDMIDQLLLYLYNDGNPLREPYTKLVKKFKWEFKNQRAYDRLKSRILREQWVTMWGTDDSTGLTQHGLRCIERYGSFKIYLNDWAAKEAEKLKEENREKKRKKRRENLEFVLKNTGSLVAIILSLSTLLTTILAITDKRDLIPIEQELKQLRLVQDTLVQKLNSPQKPAGTSPLKPDSISK